MKILILIIAIASLVILTSGCVKDIETVLPLTNPPVLSSPTPKQRLRETKAPADRTVLPSATSTKSVTPTIEMSTPTPLPPTWTPLPTLNSEEASEFVSKLLQDNGGCLLPCFWGMTPGITTWDKAMSFLQSFTRVDTFKASTSIYIAAQIPFPVYLGTVSHDYEFIENKLVSIEAYNGKLAPIFFLPEFLRTYGVPTGIYIRTFREEEAKSQPFLIDLFYPEKGILMEYSGGKGVDNADYVVNCLEGLNSPFLYLWSPEQELTFEEAIRMFLDTENFPEPVPLKEATGVDIEAFYEGILGSEVFCIQTPKELWP